MSSEQQQQENDGSSSTPPSSSTITQNDSTTEQQQQQQELSSQPLSTAEEQEQERDVAAALSALLSGQPSAQIMQMNHHASSTSDGVAYNEFESFYSSLGQLGSGRSSSGSSGDGENAQQRRRQEQQQNENHSESNNNTTNNNSNDSEQQQQQQGAGVLVGSSSDDLNLHSRLISFSAGSAADSENENEEQGRGTGGVRHMGGPSSSSLQPESSNNNSNHNNSEEEEQQQQQGSAPPSTTNNRLSFAIPRRFVRARRPGGAGQQQQQQQQQPPSDQDTLPTDDNRTITTRTSIGFSSSLGDMNENGGSSSTEQQRRLSGNVRRMGPGPSETTSNNNSNSISTSNEHSSSPSSTQQGTTTIRFSLGSNNHNNNNHNASSNGNNGNGQEQRRGTVRRMGRGERHRLILGRGERSRLIMEQRQGASGGRGGGVGGGGVGVGPRDAAAARNHGVRGGRGPGGRQVGRPVSLQLHVPPGARVRLQRGGGGVGAVGPGLGPVGPMMGGPGVGGPGLGHEFRVPPLQPQVMMDSLQGIRSEDDEDEKKGDENGEQRTDDSTTSNTATTTTNQNNNLERFKCTLCCEYTIAPYGCGADQCDSRFCSECVAKLGLTNTNNGMQRRQHRQQKRCPTCRNEVQDFVLDESLQSESNDMAPIPCRYQGCQERLKLAFIAAHEQICPMVRMSCKYKPFGCSWTGPRCDLAAHEENDCPLAKISVLVEQHRVMRAMQQQQFGHLNMRTQMTGQLAESHNQRIAQLERGGNNAVQRVTTSNPIDVVSFVSALIVSLPNFYKLEPQWRTFLTVEGRAAVFNMTTMLAPTMIFIKLLFEFYARALQVLERDDTDTSSSSSQQGDRGLSLAGISLLACILIGSVFLLDNKSSRTWKYGTRTLFRQVAFPGLHLMAAVFAMNFFGLFRGMVLLWWSVLSSVFFPVLVTGVAIRHARSAGADAMERFMSNPCDTGRAFSPLVFAFQMALPCTIFGPTSAFAAVLLVEAVQPLCSHVPIAFAMKPYFPVSSIDRKFEYIVLFVAFYAGASLPHETLIDAAQNEEGSADSVVALGLIRQEFLNNMIDQMGRTLLSFVTLITTNVFIWSLSQLGTHLAAKLIEWDPIPPPRTLPDDKNPSVGGSVVVATWVAVLVFIAAT